jgi:hypothetical protein
MIRGIFCQYVVIAPFRRCFLLNRWWHFRYSVASGFLQLSCYFGYFCDFHNVPPDILSKIHELALSLHSEYVIP